MSRLNELLQELGLSKVKLAKYLGVSRQMVYNYLVLDSLDKWPKEKKVLLLQLLDIKDGSEESIESITVDTQYLMSVEKRLNMAIKSTNNIESFVDLNNLSKENKTLLNDFIFLLKEKLEEDDNDSADAIRYMYYMLQSMENIPEIKYIMGYMAKSNGFIKPDEYAFDEDKQFVFEGILYSALTLYNNGGASKSKLQERHRRFIQEIEAKNEEKLSRTQELNTVKIQALRELGYNDINPSNASEVFEKIAEIQSRKV
jgi:predicted transcriptional regulator